MKNKNGEGSIIQRKDGTYTVRIMNGKKPDGKPNIKERRAKTEKEARQKLKALKKEIGEEARRKTVGFTDYTTEEYFNMFLQYKKRTLSDTSYARLDSTIRTHIFQNLGMTFFCNLTSEDIQNIIDDMHASGKSHSSVKKVYDAFNACFTWAVEKRKDILPIDNPMWEVEMITTKKFVRNKIRSFNEQELEAFKLEALRTFKNGNYAHKLGPAFILMLNIGVREGELCAIDRNRDIQGKELSVQDTAVTIKNENRSSEREKKWVTVINENDTKTTSGQRIIPLNDTALEMIEILNNNFPQHKDHDLLLYNNNGGIIPPANLVKPFKHICEVAGIKNLKGKGPHVLRHTFATKCFEKGFDVKVVSELLGHKDVLITQNTYIDVIQSQKAKAVQMIEI